MENEVFLTVWRVFSILGIGYLAVIGTLKWIMMRRLDCTVEENTKTLRTHSKRIAAMLFFVAEGPEPPSGGVEQAAKRANVLSIARDASHELDEEKDWRTAHRRMNRFAN